MRVWFLRNGNIRRAFSRTEELGAPALEGGGRGAPQRKEKISTPWLEFVDTALELEFNRFMFMEQQSALLVYQYLVCAAVIAHAFMLLLDCFIAAQVSPYVGLAFLPFFLWFLYMSRDRERFMRIVHLQSRLANLFMFLVGAWVIVFLWVDNVHCDKYYGKKPECAERSPCHSPVVLAYQQFLFGVTYSVLLLFFPIITHSGFMVLAFLFFLALAGCLIDTLHRGCQSSDCDSMLEDSNSTLEDVSLNAVILVILFVFFVFISRSRALSTRRTFVHIRRLREENIHDADIVLDSHTTAISRWLLGSAANRVAPPANVSWLVDYKDLNFIRPIGEGSYGHVYLAEWKGSNVAIKTLKKSGSLSPESKATINFAQEIDIVSQIRHPHIVLFMGAGVDNNHAIFLMTEYMDQGSLSDLIRTPSVYLSPFMVTSIFAQTAAGLKFLHSGNRAHGDLKPANILLDSRYNCKLADFGVTFISELKPVEDTAGDAEATEPGNAGSPGTNELSGGQGFRYGTLAYAAPEVLHGRRPSPASDMYSLAMTMWEVAALEVPHSALIDESSAAGLIYMVAEAKFRPEVPDNLPNRDVAELMTRLWNPSPKDRPTADAAHRILEAQLPKFAEDAPGLAFASRLKHKNGSMTQDGSNPSLIATGVVEMWDNGRRWSADPAGSRRDVSTINRIVSTSIPSRSGFVQEASPERIVVGFWKPPTAMEWAYAVMTACRAAKLPVRLALHWGSPEDATANSGGVDVSAGETINSAVRAVCFGRDDELIVTCRFRAALRAALHDAEMGTAQVTVDGGTPGAAAPPRSPTGFRRESLVSANDPNAYRNGPSTSDGTKKTPRRSSIGRRESTGSIASVAAAAALGARRDSINSIAGDAHDSTFGNNWDSVVTGPEYTVLVARVTNAKGIILKPLTSITIDTQADMDYKRRRPLEQSEPLWSMQSQRSCIILGDVLASSPQTEVIPSAIDSSTVTVKRCKAKWVSFAQQLNFFETLSIMHRLEEHPNVVKVIGGIFDVPEMVAVVYEWMPRSLQSIMLEEPETLRAARDLFQIAQGLLFLHEHGVVHRQLVPSNIFKGSDNQFKLGDLCSHVLKTDAATQTHTGVGTLTYAAPEVLKGARVSAKSDIYTFGMLAFEVATGEPAYQGDPMAFSRDIVAGSRPTLPPDVDGVIAQTIVACWQGVPADRPSARMVLRMLNKQQDAAWKEREKERFEREQQEQRSEQAALASTPVPAPTPAPAPAALDRGRTPTPPPVKEPSDAPSPVPDVAAGGQGASSTGRDRKDRKDRDKKKRKKKKKKASDAKDD